MSVEQRPVGGGLCESGLDSPSANPAQMEEQRHKPASIPFEYLRPRSAPEIVDAAVQLARRHYWPMLLVSIGALLPYLVFDLYFGVTGYEPSMLTAVLTSAIAGSFADAAAAAVAFGSLTLPAADIRSALVAIRRFPVIALAGLYRSVFLVAGVAILIVPALFVIAMYALVPGIAVFEPRLGIGGSLRRSRDLTGGHRMRALLCYGLPYGAVTVGLIFTSSGVESVGGGHGKLLGLMAGTFIAMACTPFVAALQLMLYLDLRVRKEALDLETGIAGLGGARGAIAQDSAAQ